MTHIDQTLKELFVALHTSGLWEDEKVLSDAVLRAPAEDILAAYERERTLPSFDLRAFFETHFRTATSLSEERAFVSDPKRGPLEHIQALWPFLHRATDLDEASTKVPLPHSYVVPGGRFQEVYYWDSYFTQLGLLLHGKEAWVRDLLDNFAYLIQTFGHVPNGNRTYYLSRSQPPFFALMVDSLAQLQDSEEARLAVYQRYLEPLRAEHRFWTRPERTHRELQTYWDRQRTPRIEMLRTDLELARHEASNPDFFLHLRAACESGWDFSSRWLENPDDLGSIKTAEILPVDLNSLLYFHENLLFQITGLEDYRVAANRRKEQLGTLFFDAQSGYRDLWKKSLTPTPVLSAATLYPLFVGAASAEQAAVVAGTVERELLQQGGLATTALRTGQQWDAPNGWAPLNYIAVEGLHRYGFTELAREVAQRWIHTCDVVYRRDGKFVEKYNVYAPDELSGGGEYALQDGFGWSNGVYVALDHFLTLNGK